jgi:hypothetical protein
MYCDDADLRFKGINMTLLHPQWMFIDPYTHGGFCALIPTERSNSMAAAQCTRAQESDRVHGRRGISGAISPPARDSLGTNI